MRRILTVLITGALSLWVGQSARAGLVATWSLDNTWTGAAGNATTPAISPTTGPNSPFSAAVLYGTTTANAGNGGAGITRVLNTGSDYYMHFSSGNANGNSLNGSYFILQLTTSAAISGPFTIQYTAQRSNDAGGPTTDTWAYSMNSGGTWTTFGTDTIGTSFASFSQTTPTLTASAGSSIWFRDMFSGATDNKGTTDFNNISVSAVPEPVNVALGIFAGVLVVGGVARTRAVRNRIQRWRTAVVQWVDAV